MAILTKQRKGIIMAGGTGSRLYPATLPVSKQLLPIYDKPMIYYPLTTLMLAGIRDVLIISTPIDLPRFSSLLGDGSKWGISISYCEQNKPEGAAQAFRLGREFLNNHPSALILGDNLFYGHNLQKTLQEANECQDGAKIFAYRVTNPSQYGVIEFDKLGEPISIEEKPDTPKSNYAIVGLYFYDESVCDVADRIKPSVRGELEISAINNIYLNEKRLGLEFLRRGYAWLDTGTHDSLLEASQFIATLERRQGFKVACPEEVAFRSGWISDEQLMQIVRQLGETDYSKYLSTLVN